MDAAESLFVERGPDALTMQDVATQAGVSRPLALHYFSTYEELVRSVLRRRNARLGAQVLGALLESDGALDAQALLRSLLTALGDPVHARLLAWASLSGQSERLAVVKNAGLAKIVDGVERRVQKDARDHDRPAPTRAAIDHAVLVASAAVLGFATCRSILLPAFGQRDDEDGERLFERALREAVLDGVLSAR